MYAAAAFALAPKKEPKDFHVSDVSQSSAVLFPPESLPSCLFFQVSSRFSTLFSMITSTGGLYLLPYSSLYQQLSEPASLSSSSTLTTTAPEEELETHTFSLLSHTPPLPFGISSTSTPGTKTERSLPEENKPDTTDSQRNNTSSGPCSSQLSSTASTPTSSALSLTTDMP